MAAPPGQELRQCLSPASGSRAHTFMRFLHVGGDSVVEMAPHCAWGKRPTSRAKALLNSIDFCLEFSSPTSGIGNPYLTCLTQKLLFEQCQDLLFLGYTHFTCKTPRRRPAISRNGATASVTRGLPGLNTD